jgi:hypothetical protein
MPVKCASYFPYHARVRENSEFESQKPVFLKGMETIRYGSATLFTVAFLGS